MIDNKTYVALAHIEGEEDEYDPSCLVLLKMIRGKTAKECETKAYKELYEIYVEKGTADKVTVQCMDTEFFNDWAVIDKIWTEP